MANSIHFQFAVYYLPLPSKDPSATLRQILTRKPDKLKLVERMPDTPDELLVCAHVLNAVQKEYPPPAIKSLRYFGHGLTQEQMNALQKCKQAFILDFRHPKKNVWEGLRTANEIAELIARETGGILWDEETREVYSPDEWHRKRIASWTEEFPDISTQTIIHVYKPKEYVRAITLGMSKIGLPDVIIENISWSIDRSMVNLINLFCQSLAEGATIKKPGEFDLNLRAVKTRKVRDPHIESLKPNAVAIVFLSLKKGKWEQGDPQNRLIEIDFDKYAGPNAQARQGKMLESLFGWEDTTISVKHNEELLAASRKVKEKLPALYKAFTEGLQPGEYIQLKAPFATSEGGNEWMWVEVIAWKENKIKGLLKNEPTNIPFLQVGQLVEIKQEDVFDYIRYFPDGREEGNTTGDIIRKIQQEKNK